MVPLMKARYQVGEMSAAGEAENASFLLTNEAGSFYYHNQQTKYGGWSVFDGELFHVLSELRLAAPAVSGVVHHLSVVDVVHGALREQFAVPRGERALVHRLNAETDIGLVLDVHRPYDSRAFGRFYRVEVEEGRTIITFVKKTDRREDRTHGDEEFVFFVVVNAPGRVLGRWEERVYAQDALRKDASRRFVYHAARFHAAELVVTAGRDLQEALRSNARIAANVRKAVAAQRAACIRFAQLPLEVAAASWSLQGLRAAAAAPASADRAAPPPCVWAGLPWFFQEWTRDEAVALKALMLLGEFDLAKRIVFSLLERIDAQGLLPARIPAAAGDLRSADAVGWLFVRCGEYHALKGFTKEEKSRVEEALVRVLESHEQLHTRDGLASHGPQESWMDTASRSQAIELQALRLALERVAFQLTKNVIYRERGQALRERVRTLLWDGTQLADSAGDGTARPNVFLAAYAYPELLTKREWKRCFSAVLPKLWLAWGGLATIGLSDARFRQEYTGMDDKSYHHGDSWFWVNNIAALVMHRIDARGFRAYWAKILQASTRELLWSGALGHAAELSSAKELRSEGCVSQAWSAATLVELWNELKGKQARKE